MGIFDLLVYVNKCWSFPARLSASQISNHFRHHGCRCLNKSPPIPTQTVYFLQVKYTIYIFIKYKYCSIDGEVVIIMVCHAVVLGSIPSRCNRKIYFFKKNDIIMVYLPVFSVWLNLFCSFCARERKRTINYGGCSASPRVL